MQRHFWYDLSPGAWLLVHRAAAAGSRRALLAVGFPPYNGREGENSNAEDAFDAVSGDGFAIRQGIWPGYVGPCVEQVVPLLQQRGVVRTEYTETTLREHL